MVYIKNTMNEEKSKFDVDKATSSELKEYIAILLDRINALEKSRDHYERIVKALSK
jgi:RAB protein geranylgeranyltransferase component A